MNLHITQYVELLSLFCAIIFYNKLGFFKLKAFIVLLIIVCIAEICGANKLWFGLTKNYIIYDYYTICSTPVYFYLFMKMMDFKGFIKTIYIVITGLVMVFVVFNLYFLQGQDSFNTYSLIMTEFIKGILSLMVITKLFREDNYEIGIINNPYFWISGSVLIFSICAIVLFGLQQFIIINKIQIEGKSIYRIITPVIDVVLYLSFCYAFYLCKKLTNKLLLL